jgi:hypothetical protein
MTAPATWWAWGNPRPYRDRSFGGPLPIDKKPGGWRRYTSANSNAAWPSHS